MKLYLSIGVLCAITVALIGAREISNDSQDLTIPKYETPITPKQKPPSDVLAKTSAPPKWSPPPTPDVRKLPSPQPLDQQVQNQLIENSATAFLVDESTIISPLPPLPDDAPSEPSFVRQVAFLEPVSQEEMTPVRPIKFDADSNVRGTRLHSKHKDSKYETSIFEDSGADSIEDLKESSDLLYGEGLSEDDSEDDIENDIEDDIEGGIEDDFEDLDNDYDDEDTVEGGDFATDDLNEFWDPRTQIPNEAEQIGALLDQISNHRVTAAAHEIRWSLDDAIMASLAYSNRISSLRIESTEALQNVGVEYGQFDIAAFVTQSFRDSAEPVGSSIDTASGVQPIVNENDLNIAYGLRRQLRTGGDFEISQSYQFLDNDSGILVPEDQAIARINGRLTKELLRGAGRSIAMNQVLVAQYDASAQREASVANIADHLNEVMTAYWDIFAARGALFASMENRQMAIEVRRELNARKDIDAERNLIDQSEATIRQRELQINDAHSDLVQAQIRFISLVNAPELLDNSNNLEILPQVAPDLEHRDLDIDSRVNTAIQRRPEIGDIIEQIRSAQVTNHFSLNDLLPRLSLSLEASLNGLEGDSQLGDAISNQFDNDLTYQVGADFEVPLANRRARFNKRRTELVVARLRADWQVLIQEVKADVLDNAQEFAVTQQRLQTQREVLKFTANELRYLALRKTIAPKESDNVSFALTQVLSAQDRQGGAKSDFIAAIADKHRAIFELNRATGILINSDVIPLDGGPGCPNCFSVYHQFIEERGVLDGPLDLVEAEIRAKSQCPIGHGVGRLNLDSCSCGCCGNETACGPACEPIEQAIQARAELPAAAVQPRYPLQ